MKKKQLKNLRLHTYKVANLTLMNSTKGGTLTTTTEVDTNQGIYSAAQFNCPTEILVCASQNFTDCTTNGGITKTQPPTEYEGCISNGIGG